MSVSKKERMERKGLLGALFLPASKVFLVLFCFSSKADVLSNNNSDACISITNSLSIYT